MNNKKLTIFQKLDSVFSPNKIQTTPLVKGSREILRTQSQEEAETFKLQQHQDRYLNNQWTNSEANTVKKLCNMK